MGKIVYLDPTNQPVFHHIETAPRPSSLNELVIGVIDNGKWNADAVLRLMSEKLKQKYSIKGIEWYRKKIASQGIDRNHSEEFAKKCHVIIAGVGD